MANGVVRLSAMVKRIEKTKAALALKTMRDKLNYEDYLVAVGKFRQLSALEAQFKTELESRPADDSFDEDDGDLPPEQRLDTEDEQPEREPMTRRVRARPWGG